MSVMRGQLQPLSFSPKSLVPMVSTIIVAILMLLPLGTTTASYAMPNLVLICIFFWSTYRPLQMPLGGAALIGLFLDLWLAVPMGLMMLLAILARVFVMAQLRHMRGRSSFVQWAIFALLIIGLSFVAWGVVSIVYRDFIGPMPIIKQAILTILVYPLATIILNRIRAGLR